MGQHRAPGGWPPVLNTIGWVTAGIVLFAIAFYLAEIFL
jgi:hypothetical protein